MEALGNTLWLALIAPFADFAFMRRALVATLALAISAAPVGVFLTLRRMSLLGDALSHAVLPGVAIGYIWGGLSWVAMATGGIIAGLVVAGIAGAISRWTTLKEDASLAAIYLIALAIGILLISQHKNRLDLLHILFGSALGVDAEGLLMVASVATLSTLLLAAIYRGLVLETFDATYLRSNRQPNSGSWPLGLASWVWHQSFVILVVLNLVAGFQTLGTLMAVGLMMLPAVSARLWHDSLPAQLLNASAQAAVAGYTGLLLSYHFDLPSGPTIIFCAGGFYLLSLLLAPQGWLAKLTAAQHRVA